MEIDGTAIGDDHSPYFIAEAGVNHNGSVKRAKDLIEVASEAGADAVKFQTYKTNKLVAPNTPTATYQENSSGDKNQHEMLKRYELDRSDHQTLIDSCLQNDITFLSTPFDPQSADMLYELGVNAIKVGSGDLDNHPLLSHIAVIGLPMVVSTGMATMEEVTAAYNVIRDSNPAVDVVFLHCTSAYPTNVHDVNLRSMRTMDQELSTFVGYSDHTTLIEIPALATIAGATVIEKHFTLDSNLEGPDHETSLEPDELEEAIDLVELATAAKGNSEKRPVLAEMENRATSRKSLHAAVDIPEGTRIKESHLEIIRPADGISPRYYESIIDAEAISDIKKGDPINESLVEFRV